MMSTRIDSMMGALSETQQRPIRRHRGYIEKNGWNIFSIPKDDLFKMKRDCGTDRAAILLGCSAAQITERLAPGSEMRQQKAIGAALTKIKEEKRGAFSRAVCLPHRIAIPCAECAAAQQPKEEAAPIERAKPIADDPKRLVRLDSLKPGQQARTMIDEEGLGGTTVTLLRIGTGSATVRLAGTRRSMTVREPGLEQESKTVEFDAPGKAVSWALATMVIPLD